MNNDDITVMTKYDTQALNVEKVKHSLSLSECHLGEGNDHRNKECVSKESRPWITILELCKVEE